VKVLETDRLILRHLTAEDAEFMLKLMNEPSYLRFIGDKGIENVADARQYILDGPVESYARYGYGLNLTERKIDGTPIGICGLVNRSALDGVDIGFAFLFDYWSNGYAHEAAKATLEYAKKVVGLDRILAITAPDNRNSIKLLEKMGFKFERMLNVFADEPDVNLYAREA
jgi:RimJ/RimL family protein N-acetyltransferase